MVSMPSRLVKLTSNNARPLLSPVSVILNLPVNFVAGDVRVVSSAENSK